MAVGKGCFLSNHGLTFLWLTLLPGEMVLFPGHPRSLPALSPWPQPESVFMTSLQSSGRSPTQPPFISAPHPRLGVPLTCLTTSLSCLQPSDDHPLLLSSPGSSAQHAQLSGFPSLPSSPVSSLPRCFKVPAIPSVWGPQDPGSLL